MRKIKVALIGLNANSHSAQIFTSVRKQSDIFEVVGYSLPEGEGVKYPKKLKALEGLQELSLNEVLEREDIEAVILETDEEHLTRYATLFIKNGKHVHMEKPGGCDLSEFEKLTSLVKECGKVFHIGYMYRYNPFVKEVISRAVSGELGEILSVEAQMNCAHPDSIRRWLNNFKGGMMFFLGCHLIDIVLQIQGEPKNIIPLNKCTDEEIGSEDFGMAIMEYEKGVSFVKTSACELGGFARRQLVVTGTKATVELKPFEMFCEGKTNLYTAKTEYTSSEWGNMGESVNSEPFDRYDDMMRAFYKMVIGKIKNPYTPDYELSLYKNILKCCNAK
ncbi:MAG: Gfo/Idh/MocA family oxidoreductase [Ruminococcaceae bacterium]|nr:Gfo/Idh/MocA family oxidoreductase [Oscillospiraceae bacterium]